MHITKKHHGDYKKDLPWDNKLKVAAYDCWPSVHLVPSACSQRWGRSNDECSQRHSLIQVHPGTASWNLRHLPRKCERPHSHLVKIGLYCATIKIVFAMNYRLQNYASWAADCANTSSHCANGMQAISDPHSPLAHGGTTTSSTLIPSVLTPRSRFCFMNGGGKAKFTQTFTDFCRFAPPPTTHPPTCSAGSHQGVGKILESAKKDIAKEGGREGKTDKEIQDEAVKK